MGQSVWFSSFLQEMETVSFLIYMSRGVWIRILGLSVRNNRKCHLA